MSSRSELEVQAFGVDTRYPIVVEVGGARRLAPLMDRFTHQARIAVIADETVASLHAQAVREGLGRDSDLYAFPAGETAKSVRQWSRLSESLLDGGHDRHSVVVALGGGVTGDLAGFVAATFMRGIPVVQVPTTLLAMIDSSVGGKTGVNLPQGKNLLGAFHAPRFVMIDPEFSATLSARQRAQGLVEALKHGAIRSLSHLERIEGAVPDLLAGDPERTADVVAESVAVKAEIVSQDERESGLRRILNFGHTIGHALERVSEYRLPHGEAVARGMAVEALLGERIGVTERGTVDRLRQILAALGVETGPGPWSLSQLVAATRSDKKAQRGRPGYVLLERLGRTAPGEGWLHEPGESEVVGALQSWG